MTASAPLLLQDQPQHDQSGRRRGRLAAAFALIFTLLAAACSGGFDAVETATQSSSDVAPMIELTQDADAYGVADYDISGDDTAYESESSEAANLRAVEPTSALAALTVTGAAGSETVAQLPDIGRDIIYTATLDLASTDVSVATRNAIRAIEARGGFLFSQETQGGTYGSSLLTFKILPDQFHAALNDLGSVGTVRSQSISADDVSAIVVDLQSRINTAEASVDRLRDLLEGASELDTIATLENQLLQRETTLEQLRGQLRSVQNQVDLATITVSVSELTTRPSLNLEAFAYGSHDAGFGCFDSASVRSGEIGDPVTICYRLTNTGDTPLVDLAIDEPTLGTAIDGLVVVDGSTSSLEPGDSVLLAHEFELTEPVRVRTTATAVGLDADGNRIDTDVKATAATMRFDVTDFDAGFPGFGEVLGNSWNALATAAIVVALIAVAIAPFAAVALLIGWPLWKLLRRQWAARPVTVTPPAPPAPPEPSADAGTGETEADAAASATTTA